MVNFSKFDLAKAKLLSSEDIMKVKIYFLQQNIPNSNMHFNRNLLNHREHQQININ